MVRIIRSIRSSAFANLVVAMARPTSAFARISSSSVGLACVLHARQRWVAGDAGRLGSQRDPAACALHRYTAICRRFRTHQILSHDADRGGADARAGVSSARPAREDDRAGRRTRPRCSNSYRRETCAGRNNMTAGVTGVPCDGRAQAGQSLPIGFAMLDVHVLRPRGSAGWCFGPIGVATQGRRISIRPDAGMACSSITLIMWFAQDRDRPT